MANPRELRVLEALWQNVTRAIEIDLFYVVLFNKVTVKLDFPVAAQKGEDGWMRLAKESRAYQPDAWLPDAIFKDHTYILTGPNCENWPACEKKLSSLTEQQSLSWLGVPMMVGDNVIGVVVVENYQRTDAYDAHAQSLLKTMADRVANALMQTRMIDNLRAVNQVGQTLTSSVRLREDEVLERIFEQASQLMNTDNMYIALLDAERRRLSFPLARNRGMPEQWPIREVDFEDTTKGGLTEIVLRTREPLLIADVKTYCKEKNLTLPIPPVPKSWLGVPMISSGQVLGIIALQNDDIENLYGLDDQEVLQTMTGQAASAIENARLYSELSDLNKNLAERVQARTKRITALLQVGQSLNSAIRLQQSEMLTLIAEQISPLMDARNMYIALYDAEWQELSFPLARENGEPETLPSRKVELPDKSEEDFARVVEFINMTEGGLSEIVLHQQKPFLVGNVEAYCQEHKLTLPIAPIPKSWMGVPIIFEGEILGIISLRSRDFEDAYNSTDLEVLQTMAGQAATAFENSRLYEELRRINEDLEQIVQERTEELRRINENLEQIVQERTEELSAAKQIAALGTAMASLQHRINNTLNVIIPNIKRLRRRVDLTDPVIIEILDIIDRNALYTAEIIGRIQDQLRKGDLQNVNINSVIIELLEDIRKTRSADSTRPLVVVETNLNESLPLIEIPVGQIAEVFRNLIDNAYRAMKIGGQLTVTTSLSNDVIEIKVQDTGPGIPPDIEKRIFTKPVPSSEQRAGAGLGLWLSQLTLQSLGGSIIIKETSISGTVMLVRVPLPDAGKKRAQ